MIRPLLAAALAVSVATVAAAQYRKRPPFIEGCASAEQMRAVERFDRDYKESTVVSGPLAEFLSRHLGAFPGSPVVVLVARADGTVKMLAQIPAPQCWHPEIIAPEWLANRGRK